MTDSNIQGLATIFEFAWSCFTQEFELFGFTVSWFGIAVAFFIVCLPFVIIRRISDL